MQSCCIYNKTSLCHYKLPHKALALSLFLATVGHFYLQVSKHMFAGNIFSQSVDFEFL